MRPAKVTETCPACGREYDSYYHRLRTICECGGWLRLEVEEDVLYKMC